MLDHKEARVCRPRETLLTSNLRVIQTRTAVLLSLCCAAPGAVAGRYLMHLSIDYCSSCRETLSAALLRCCCRATRANVDLLRTRCIRGRHHQRVVRFDELLHGALELHSIGASLRRRLFYGGEASIPQRV